eukprot:TRINITY_DN708_c0_g2_i2.p1 TRINITY_DN708_c0_g2~~TRINITY_DN708_c0_g2_i2.p1  ORF type:complete len:540 (-),score=79.69 TRINITY_DN708_c0_g2_i2:40-1596(-)
MEADGGDTVKSATPVADATGKGKGKERAMDIEEENKTPSFPINASNRKFDAELFGSTICKGFTRLFEHQSLSDVTLNVKDKDGAWTAQFPAHKIVLSAWSDKLAGLVNNDSTQVSLEVSGVDKDTFGAILKYMYTGSVSFLNGTNILPTIILTQELGIAALKEVAGDLLGEHVSESNLFYLIDVVNRFDIARLTAACGTFLAEHFSEMWEDVPERLLALSVNTWVAMLKSDYLLVRSEEELFECVVRYVNNLAGLTATSKLNTIAEEAYVKLLPQLRWTYINPRYLIKTVEVHPQLGPLPLVHQLLHETYKYRMFSSPKVKVSFSTTLRKGSQRFDPEKCDKNYIRLSDEGETATLFSGGWQNVRCVCPFSVKYDYIEWKVNAGANMMLGVVDGDCARNTHAGQHANGWTYYSPGQLYHAGTIPTQGQAYSSGDTIGCHVDITKGIVTFYRNGKKSMTLGGLPTNKVDALFPIACFSSQSSGVSIVRGATCPVDYSELPVTATPAPDLGGGLFGDDDY